MKEFAEESWRLTEGLAGAEKVAKSGVCSSGVGVSLAFKPSGA